MMIYTEEIEYRKTIMSKIHSGEKVTSEERLWLVTHPLYNRLLGYPYLNADIISLLPNTCYRVQIKVEKNMYPDRIIPVINAPGGKGKIVSNSQLFNYKGEPTSGKAVKMLAVIFDSSYNEIEIIYESSIGQLGVSFECEYFDYEQGIIIRKNSNVGDPNYSMVRECLSDNRILYRCKPPKCDSFENFIFSVEWTKDSAQKT